MPNGSDFSVIIATRNRRHLLPRAIASALSQEGHAPEVIVVDDASTDGTPEYVARAFPTVRLHCLDRQGGPGPARNLGLQVAGGRWAVILDDDDELLPDALRTIARRLAEFDDRRRYPAFLFRHGNGTLGAPFQLIGVADLWSGLVRGDFLAVWQRDVALATGCRYPQSRIGAEGLLWLEVAERYGIPTWADCVGTVHADADRRLTGVEAQLQHAAEHARIQDRYVEVLSRQQPTAAVRRALARRLVAAGFYSLLAGERRHALARAFALLSRRSPLAISLALACCLPRGLLAVLLRVHHRRQRSTAQD